MTECSYRSVVTDPASLVEHAQNGLQLIERKMEEESTGGGPESTADIIVLDDVSPHYMKAVVALQACDARLGAALRSLVDFGEDEPSAASLPALSAARAQTDTETAGAADVFSASPLRPWTNRPTSSWRACLSESGCPSPCR